MLLENKVSAPFSTRDSILQGALEEFAALGFNGATTRGIASRVGLSNGVIRYHYESKEKLWFAAVEYLFTQLDEETRSDPIEREKMMQGDVDMFRAWLRRYVYYCARHPEHARIIFQECVAKSGRLEVAVERYIKPSHQDALIILDGLKEVGIFPKHVNSISILYIISGACQTVFALAPEVDASLGYDSLSDEAIEAHADAVVSIFFPQNRPYVLKK